MRLETLQAAGQPAKTIPASLRMQSFGFERLVMTALPESPGGFSNRPEGDRRDESTSRDVGQVECSKQSTGAALLHGKVARERGRPRGPGSVQCSVGSTCRGSRPISRSERYPSASAGVRRCTVGCAAARSAETGTSILRRARSRKRPPTDVHFRRSPSSSATSAAVVTCRQ